MHYSKVLPLFLLNVSFAMATTYKLTYYNVMAVAEPIRYLLSYGNLPFEDIRLTPEEWSSQKNNSPFGQIPLFEVDNKMFHQSLAIARFVAGEVKLMGKNNLENMEIDAIVDTISEMRGKVATYNKLDNNSEEKEPARQELLKVTLPFYLTKFNKIAEPGHMATGKFTWADIYFVALLDYNNGVMKTDIIKGYPNLIKIRDEVVNIPEIKHWIETRPQCEY